MRTHGWSSPFRQRPWEKIDTLFGEMADHYVHFRHTSDIVKSVLAFDRATGLAACTSMHDLIVVPTPIVAPPYGVVAVRAPGSMHESVSGMVRIEHLSVTGHDEVIDRPVAEVIPLFWRFMIEKFGVDPGPGEPRR